MYDKSEHLWREVQPEIDIITRNEIYQIKTQGRDLPEALDNFIQNIGLR